MGQDSLKKATRGCSFKVLTTNEAELVPALAEGLLLFGEVDVLGASGANSGHLGEGFKTSENK